MRSKFEKKKITVGLSSKRNAKWNHGNNNKKKCEISFSFSKTKPINWRVQFILFMVNDSSKIKY